MADVLIQGESVGSDLARPLIRRLDSHTVNQIAAGEVVERPAAALKELIENSLDAEARVIRIDLEGSGVRLIQVADDGLGMDEESARLALERHATSKITRAEDLLSVGTFGFRGEALPSIASVSRLVLTTGPSDGALTRIVVDQGTFLPVERVSGSRGTTVRVEELFASTPARLKFLKSESTELSACVEVVQKAAMARPDVRFQLRHGSSTLVQTSGSGRLMDALGEIWGRETASALIPVDLFTGSARVRGLVSPPHFTKPTRSMQWLFVNGRPMRSRALLAAIDQACRSLTPEKRHIAAVLMLEMDPARLDVNVSPTKSEVKFHQEGQVFDAVRRAVKESLLGAGMVPEAGDLARADEALRGFTSSGFGGGFGAPVGNGGLFDNQHFAAAPLHALVSQGAMAPGGEAAPSTSLPDLLEGLRIIGQFDRTFILAENDAGLLMIDQHVAHERVIYERLCRTRGSAPVEVQTLLVPEPIHLDRRVMPRILPRLGELAELGFVIEPFGPDSLLVRGLPALHRLRPPLQILKDVLDRMAEGMAEGCVEPARDEVYILCSCKMAVKAGDLMGLAEMERLVQDLAETENPYFCPHGRPITIVLPKPDLRRRFKR